MCFQELHARVLGVLETRVCGCVCYVQLVKQITCMQVKRGKSWRVFTCPSNCRSNVKTEGNAASVCDRVDIKTRCRLDTGFSTKWVGFSAVFDKGFTNKLNWSCVWPTPLVRKSYGRAKPKLGKLQNATKKSLFCNFR